ncbi:MAG: hypothetical protein HY904_02580 [Deltaproteobacteria bacterium]|nr:hypothetical protein [Deltaproteobacteria bacterium]
MRRFAGLLSVLSAGCVTSVDGCLVPPVTDTTEPQGVVRGSVVYDGPVPAATAPAAGNVLLFLHAEHNPPPPRGSGRPVTFAVVPRAALFPEGARDGVHSAPFSIPLVPPGRYTVRALLDTRGDFEPFALTRASASRGDVAGGLVEQRDGRPALQVVEVRGGAEAASITVTLSAAAATLASDAPAAVLTGNATLLHTATAPTRLRLTALQRSPDADVAARLGLAGTAQPGLMMELGDVDLDGQPDDLDGDGVSDVYPRVLLRLIDPHDPTLLADHPSLTTIPCVVDPTPLLDTWPPPAGSGAQGVWVPALDVLCLPLAVDARPQPPAVLPEIPAGRYAVLLISARGQVWRLPNELGPQADPVGRGVAAEAVPTQGATLTVADGQRPAGSVAGTLRTELAPTGSALVLVFHAAAPPPPQGAGRPVASGRVLPEAFQQAADGYRAPYVVAGLPDGDYLVGAVLDQDRNLDFRVDTLAQPTRGDVVAPPERVTVSGGEAAHDVVLRQVVPADPPRISSAESTATLAAATATLLLDAVAVDNALLHRDAAEGRLVMSWRGGTPADADGDGLPDVWPRAVLRLVEHDPADPGSWDPTADVVLAAALDVAPVAMALGAGPSPPVSVRTVRLTVAAAAYDVRDPAHPTPLPAAPAGTYDLTLLTEHGQFSRRDAPPAELAPLAYAVPGGDGTLALKVATPAGLRLRVPAVTRLPGGLRGRVTATTTEAPGPAWVFVYDVADPGPPDGAGLPRAVVRVAPAAFAGAAGSWQADWAASGLGPARYRVSALLDQDVDFSLLGSLRAFPTAGDAVGGHVDGAGRLLEVDVVDAVVPDVDVLLARVLPLGPPAFRLGADELDRPLAAPLQLVLESLRDAAPALDPRGAVPLAADEVAFAVTLRDADADGQPDDTDRDGLPDLYPRVLLRLVDPAIPGGLADATGAGARTVPAVPDPARYLPALLTGTPAVVVTSLATVVLPVAVDATGGVVRPEAGAHSVTVVTSAGAAWRVPNTLGPELAAGGGGVASQGTRAYVTQSAAPAGGISGALALPLGVCADVVVAARRADAGLDAPLLSPDGLVIARARRDAAGACVEAPSTYAMGGVRPGSYVVSAVVDVDGDFLPFWVTRRGPSAGDVAGVALDGADPRVVVVGGEVVAGVDVAPLTVLPLERPAFRVESGWPVSGTAGTAVRTALVTLGPAGVHVPLADIDGAANAFTTSVEQAGGSTVVWPLVLLARLDESDPRGLRLREPLEMMLAEVDSSGFTGATATRLEVIIRGERVGTAGATLGRAAPGRYAIIVVNRGGQSWQVPNELNPSVAVGGATLPGTAGQGGAWTVP